MMKKITAQARKMALLVWVGTVSELEPFPVPELPVFLLLITRKQASSKPFLPSVGRVQAHGFTNHSQDRQYRILHSSALPPVPAQP